MIFSRTAVPGPLARDRKGPVPAKITMGTSRRRKSSLLNSRKVLSEVAVLITHLQDEMTGCIIILTIKGRTCH
jgi:hypothetical protein